MHPHARISEHRQRPDPRRGQHHTRLQHHLPRGDVKIADTGVGESGATVGLHRGVESQQLIDRGRDQTGVSGEAVTLTKSRSQETSTFIF